MKPFTIFDRHTGRILRVAHLPDGITPKPDPSAAYLPGEYDDARHYIPGASPIARPAMNLTLSGDVISGIPEGATVEIDGDPADVADGATRVTQWPPHGESEIYISCWPYRSEWLTIRKEESI